jgi:hypothetical protein
VTNHVTPEQGVASDKGVEIMAAILASVPDGRALHDAYAHDLATWRESDAGQEIIEAFDQQADYDPMQVRDLVAGRFADESQDPFIALRQLVNGDLLALAEELNDVATESEDEIEPVPTRKLRASSDAGVDPRGDPADEEPGTSDTAMSSAAAAAELDQMAKSDSTALEEANASAARTVASLISKKHENSESLLGVGRADAEENLGGAVPRLSPPGGNSAPAEAVDGAESSAPSISPVIKMTTYDDKPQGVVPVWRPKPEDVRGFDEQTDIGAWTEGGVPAVEAPDATGAVPSPSFEVTNRPFALIPELAADLVAAEGRGAFNPTLTVGDRPFYEWSFPSLSDQYFFSSAENFDARFSGPRDGDGGPAPLPPCPGLPAVCEQGPPLTPEEKEVYAGTPWRLALLGAKDEWAGESWGQPPPLLATYATPSQYRAFGLRMGLATKFRVGTTPERVVQSSPLLWQHCLGSFVLLEDSLAHIPAKAASYFWRDGNGACIGTGIKKVQFMLLVRILMLQTTLCPTENLQTWSTTSSEPDYAEQAVKLEWLQWLVENVLASPRSNVVAHFGTYDGNEPGWAQQVHDATRSFTERWYPNTSPELPDVATCVRLADLLPYTHSVNLSEERSSFGVPSVLYGGDCFRIKSGTIPTTFPGSGENITFPLPHLSKDGKYAWTETSLWHPHNLDKSDYAAKSQWNKPYLSTFDVWQIGRSANSDYPLKDAASSRPFRDGGRWIAIVQDPKVVQHKKTEAGLHGATKFKILKPPSKEEWPSIFDTGRLYARACRATRKTLPDWVEAVRLDPSLLVGPQTWQADIDFRRATQGVKTSAAAKAKAVRGRSSETERASTRSRSPGAAGAGERTPSPPQPPSDPGPSLPPADPVVIAQRYKTAESKQADAWADHEFTEPWHVTPSEASIGIPESAADPWVDTVDEGPAPWVDTVGEGPAPASRASSDASWQMPRPKKRAASSLASAGGTSLTSSKSSRVSNALSALSGFMRKPPPSV